MKKEFQLEYQYQEYLKKVALKESDMHPQQRKQLRQAFMGACGQLIILLRDDVGKLEESDAIKVMQDMINQVGNYFLKESGKQN